MGYPMMNGDELAGCRERALIISMLYQQPDVQQICEDVNHLLHDIEELRAALDNMERYAARLREALDSARDKASR